MDSNEQRMKLLCRDILDDKITRDMLKALANTYLSVIEKEILTKKKKKLWIK